MVLTEFMPLWMDSEILASWKVFFTLLVKDDSIFDKLLLIPIC